MFLTFLFSLIFFFPSFALALDGICEHNSGTMPWYDVDCAKSKQAADRSIAEITDPSSQEHDVGCWRPKGNPPYRLKCKNPDGTVFDFQMPMSGTSKDIEFPTAPPAPSRSAADIHCWWPENNPAQRWTCSDIAGKIFYLHDDLSDKDSGISQYFSTDLPPQICELGALKIEPGKGALETYRCMAQWEPYPLESDGRFPKGDDPYTGEILPLQKPIAAH